MKYTDDIKQEAKQLYLQRYKVPEIAKKLGIHSKRIIYYWAAQECWTDLVQSETAESALSRRLIVLSGRENKSERELNEMDRLVGQLAKLQKHKPTAAITDEPTTAATEGKTKSKKKGKPVKNDISGITLEDIEDKF
ncbi:terminase gpP N-terminus-related DNA-binding protein [Zooshikella ganghwensis]|uniref:terminase gpP N-terminus-related DNA-binding protein n=1 Tax=Zooshikella ganghwensis TaxID=202772 RepID=UPI001E3982B7|nr:hypothetical protein [Zooshikella ganghwensis]